MTWADAIRHTHAEQPGITEELLTLSRSGGLNPYEWLFEGVPSDEFVVDLGCGSAPSRPFCGNKWLGVDRSESELGVASARGANPLVLGEMTKLPLLSECADVVVSSMSMMLVGNSSDAITEVQRVLRRGGTARFMIPTRAPIKARDRLRYVRLLSVLRTGAFFPPSSFMRSPKDALKMAGLVIVDDASMSFALKIEDSLIADRFANSLYLPGSSSERLNNARALTHRWVGSSIGIPLRRVIAQRP